MKFWLEYIVSYLNCL